MKEKYKGLTSSRLVLYTKKAALVEGNHESESSRKKVKDLELSLSEARESWKEAENGCREMCHENFELSKEFLKSLENSLSVLDVSFENSLQHVEFFHPSVHI